jgi:hypothetical protein
VSPILHRAHRAIQDVRERLQKQAVKVLIPATWIWSSGSSLEDGLFRTACWVGDADLLKREKPGDLFGSPGLVGESFFSGP